MASADENVVDESPCRQEMIAVRIEQWHCYRRNAAGRHSQPTTNRLEMGSSSISDKRKKIPYVDWNIRVRAKFYGSSFLVTSS